VPQQLLKSNHFWWEREKNICTPKLGKYRQGGGQGVLLISMHLDWFLILQYQGRCSSPSICASPSSTLNGHRLRMQPACVFLFARSWLYSLNVLSELDVQSYWWESSEACCLLLCVAGWVGFESSLGLLWNLKWISDKAAHKKKICSNIVQSKKFPSRLINNKNNRM